MTLPDNFQFSQGSLQDFVDCRRRFQLRYIERRAWPALQTEPAMEAERHMRQGALFHRLVQAHLLGVPAEALDALIQDADLERWWGHYLQYVGDLTGFQNLSGLKLHPEISLSAPLGNYRLVAKYDMVTVQPDGCLTIFDWKTSRKLPKPAWLAERLQTRVYPYLLVRAGADLNQGMPIAPEKVSMVYWYADHPDQPVRFDYNQADYQKDAEYLQALVDTIQRSGDDQFPLTDDERRCAYCVYRSLCDRGVRAGDMDASEEGLEEGEDFDFELDFEQIAEIEF
jgi:hypothetical protein